MDVVALARVLRRRWYFVLPGLLLTVVLAWYLPKTYQRPYEARATLLLVDPKTTDAKDGVATNPYLTGNDSLITTAGILASAMRAEDDYERQSGRGPTSIVDIAVPKEPPSPLVHIVVTAREADEASRDIDAVVAGAQKRLGQLQAEGAVGRDLFVTALAVEHNNDPKQTQSGRLRPTVAIVLLGFGLVVWAALVLDERSERRRARRAMRRPTSPPVDLTDEPVLVS